ncbi:hypothetical protein HAX54_053321, partial [Datura stramonium]|nr:hypothetical protein [Datura stramonium]
NNELLLPVVGSSELRLIGNPRGIPRFMGTTSYGEARGKGSQVGQEVDDDRFDDPWFEVTTHPDESWEGSEMCYEAVHPMTRYHESWYDATTRWVDRWSIR